MIVRCVLVTVLSALSATAAPVRFVAPSEGAQVIGATTLEVATDVADVDRVEFLVDGTLVGVVRTAPYRLVFDFGTSLQPHHIVAHVRSHRFRQDDIAEVRTAAVGGESITVNLVEVPLRVRAPGAVTAKDLNIAEDGVKQTIREVLFERPPSRFVFLVDRSQSMGEGKLTSALAAIDIALDLLRTGDTAQIIFFNHNFGQLEDLPRTTRASALYANVEPSGGTSLRDAVVSTVTRERTITIVLTDGSDRNSEISDEAALRRIGGANSAFFALVFDRASAFLETASQNTGGEIMTASAATVGSAMRDLIGDINSRYTLTYQSSGKKKGWRAIRITAARSGVKVLKARKGYFTE
ncbi:MAG TPA: Ig-like domain-containing protein [Thermoanaerobaculia bacterium]|nr:Ig-like domain-containing protein [Thermoanaerobaculia bacterium]